MEYVALIGNPNCGKTTLFNRLTGERAHVGNWPGVTVEVATASLRNGGAFLADLPGLYSLTAFSPEESITHTFLLEHTGSVWNLMQPETLERGLYLTMQLLEMGKNVIVVLSHADCQIDTAALAKGLGVPVVFPQELPVFPQKDAAVPYPRYCRALEGAIAEAASVLSGTAPKGGSLRFWSIAALEGSPPVCTTEQSRRLEAIRSRLEKQTGQEADSLISSERYRLIDTLLRESGYKITHAKKPKADTLLLHKYAALPIFGLLMTLLFWLCFGTIGTGMQEKMSMFVAYLSGRVGTLLQVLEAAPAIQGLVCDGVFGGLGTVLCFLPQLALLFAGMTVLEESGYLARAAFLTDHLLKRCGFTGKAFVPLLMGFGCTTSAVLAARTLRGTERERVIRLLPFCTCGAKFPICALLATSFFSAYAGAVVAGCYLACFLLGLAVTCFAGRKNAAPHFVLEMPAYRFPSPAGVLRGTWERCAEFLRKAGTVIFAMSLWIWLMGHMAFMPLPVFVAPEQSMLMRFADKITPFFAPLGFQNPQAVVALLAGIAGKEAIVSSFGVLGGTGGAAGALSDILYSIFTPLSALSFLVFCSLYTPCISALTAIGRELSVRKAIATAFWHTLLAYVCAAGLYQILSLLLSAYAS